MSRQHHSVQPRRFSAAGKPSQAPTADAYQCLVNAICASRSALFASLLSETGGFWYRAERGCTRHSSELLNWNSPFSVRIGVQGRTILLS
ncbi:hypothetical protein DPEC_G00043220 [Dallia pectoralis]|uniref:Uncharacterized protein n=1 Tax=Dallia pectoralis TaxID=75939 RepID=A0ACC2H9N1_DALPE|nr:hypothetical protein DPEC_G00043220 [Dallia pectoralis]